MVTPLEIFQYFPGQSAYLELANRFGIPTQESSAKGHLAKVVRHRGMMRQLAQIPVSALARQHELFRRLFFYLNQQPDQLSIPQAPVNLAVVTRLGTFGIISLHQPLPIMPVQPGIQGTTTTTPGLLGTTMPGKRGEPTFTAL